MRATWALMIGFVFLGVSAPGRADDWPQFRGQNGSGLSKEAKLPAKWAADKNVLWKAKVPGYGWSSPVVWGDKIFVTTAVSDKQTKPRGFGGGGFGKGGFGKGKFGKGKFGKGGFGKGGFGKGGKPPDAVYQWEVYCLDRATGKVVWHQTARKAKPTIPAQMGNTYASETPVTDGERLYAYFGTAGVYCYDLKGKFLWSKDLGTYPMMMGWGTGSSPALDGDRLFIQSDNEEKSSLVALDKKTGKELWRAKRDEKSSWSSPFIWRNSKRTEVVACGGKQVRSYDPATGKVLWELGGLGGGNANATPVADSERIYFGTGGPFGSSPLFAVKAGASGDITLGEDQTSNAGVAWYRAGAGPYLSSPLVYEGRLYVPESRGALSCYDAKTGEPLYQRKRLQGARSFTSSPWAHAGKIFCLDDTGQTFVVKAGPTFELLDKNTIDEMFWASPAASGGALFLRGVDHLYCIKE